MRSHAIRLRALLAVLLTGCAHDSPRPTPMSAPVTGLGFFCGTDSESKYIVEGANVNDPAFGTKRTSLETEFAEPATSAHWAPRARVHVGSVSGPSARAGREVRATVRPLRVGLRACHERSPSFDRASRYRLRVRLRWIAPRVVTVAIADERGPGVAADVWNCLRETLAAADWPQRSSGTQVAFALHLSAQ